MFEYILIYKILNLEFKKQKSNELSNKNSKEEGIDKSQSKEQEMKPPEIANGVSKLKTKKASGADTPC